MLQAIRGIALQQPLLNIHTTPFSSTSVPNGNVAPTTMQESTGSQHCLRPRVQPQGRLLALGMQPPQTCLEIMSMDGWFACLGVCVCVCVCVCVLQAIRGIALQQPLLNIQTTPFSSTSVPNGDVAPTTMQESTGSQHCLRPRVQPQGRLLALGMQPPQTCLEIMSMDGWFACLGVCVCVCLPVRKEKLPVRKEVLALRKEVLPVRKEKLPVRKEVLPARKEVLPMPKEVLPVCKEVLPVRKEMLLVCKEVLPMRKEELKEVLAVHKEVLP